MWRQHQDGQVVGTGEDDNQLNTAVLMSYESVVKQTWKQAMAGWTIGAPGHDLCQKSGETVNDLLAKLRCSVVKLQKELRRLGRLDKLPDEEAMVRQHMLAVFSHTRDKMVDFMVVDGTRKEDLTLKGTVAVIRRSEDAVSINGYDFEVNEKPAGKGGSGGAGRPGGTPKGGGSRAEHQARMEASTKADRARSAYARANSMQTSDVTKEMVAKLDEVHWESKFKKRTFGVRKPGAHPMGAAEGKRTRQQKEDAVLAGERPKPKPKPSMHHIQMGAGWKKRLGKGGTGMHFVAVEAVQSDREIRLDSAMDEYSSRYKKLSWLKRWSMHKGESQQGTALAERMAGQEEGSRGRNATEDGSASEERSRW